MSHFWKRMRTPVEALSRPETALPVKLAPRAAAFARMISSGVWVLVRTVPELTGRETVAAEAARGAARVAAIRPAANVRSKIGFRVFIIALLFWPAPRRWSLGAGSPSATRRPRFRDRMGALASATSMIRRTESPFDDCAHPGVVLGRTNSPHRKSTTPWRIWEQGMTAGESDPMSAAEHAAPPLTIHLFGPFEVRVSGVLLPRLRTRKGQWVLALLALRHGCDVERSWLAGTLWPDSDESRDHQSQL